VQNNAKATIARTSDLANKGIEIIQSTADATRERATSLANRGKEIVNNTTQATKDRTMSLANRSLEMVQDNLNSATQRVKPYLPENAQMFLENHIEGKSLNEITADMVNTTRKNLLCLDKKSDPTLRNLALEVTDAAKQGKLLKNVVDLSEKVVSENVKEVKTSPDSNSIVRAFQISKALAWGALNFTNQQWTMIQNNTSMNARNLLQNRIYPFMDQVSSPILTLVTWPLMRISRMIRGTFRPEPSTTTAKVEVKTSTSTTQEAKQMTSKDKSMMKSEELKSHDESNVPPTEQDDNLNVIEEEHTASGKKKKQHHKH